MQIHMTGKFARTDRVVRAKSVAPAAATAPVLWVWRAIEASHPEPWCGDSALAGLGAPGEGIL
jgi:hypothetical protein